MSEIYFDNNSFYHTSSDTHIRYLPLSNEFSMAVFDCPRICINMFRIKLNIFQLFGDDIFRSLSDWKRTKVYYF